MYCTKMLVNTFFLPIFDSELYIFLKQKYEISLYT